MKLSKRAILSVLPKGANPDSTKVSSLLDTLNNLQTPLDVPLADLVNDALSDEEGT